MFKIFVGCDNVKKILTIIVTMLLLAGCGGNTVKGAVDSYLKKYRNLDSEVLVDLESIIKNENLSSNQEEKYRDILKKQYKDLSYEIVKEEYNEDVSYVTVKISVYDLYKAQSDASKYLANNPEKFYNENNEYDNNLYLDYKLDEMKNMTDRVEYNVTFSVIKEDDKYKVVQPSEEVLEKIHGIYNYGIN